MPIMGSFSSLSVRALRSVGAAPTWQTVYDHAADGSLNGYFTYCLRQVIAASLFSPAINGTKFRITVKGAASGTWTMTEMFADDKASAGDPYDLQGTQAGPAAKRVTWATNGSGNGFSGLGNATLLSDEIDFAWNGSKDKVFSWDNGQTIGTGNMGSLASLSGASCYAQIIDGDAATLNASGYALLSAGDARAAVGIVKIEVFG